MLSLTVCDEFEKKNFLAIEFTTKKLSSNNDQIFLAQNFFLNIVYVKRKSTGKSKLDWGLLRYKFYDRRDKFTIESYFLSYCRKMIGQKMLMVISVVFN
jgi:hypothetical protein